MNVQKPFEQFLDKRQTPNSQERERQALPDGGRVFNNCFLLGVFEHEQVLERRGRGGSRSLGLFICEATGPAQRNPRN
jgi:hypothetical protein